MAIICPTVTAYNEHEYRYQLNRVAPLTKRIHLDFMDGLLTPTRSPLVSTAWWPEGKIVDIHLMYQRPTEQLDTVIKLKPNLLIFHAEADGDFASTISMLKMHNIKTGVALLKQTPVSAIEPIIDSLDHVLVFSGDLGRFGGHADLDLLDKARRLKSLKPRLEIGWDGGINTDNASQIAEGGVDVLNVGGAIQKADNPATAYVRLKAMVEEDKHGKS